MSEEQTPFHYLPRTPPLGGNSREAIAYMLLETIFDATETIENLTAMADGTDGTFNKEWFFGTYRDCLRTVYGGETRTGKAGDDQEAVALSLFKLIKEKCVAEELHEKEQLLSLYAECLTVVKTGVKWKGVS